jgi:hypothetical protein
MQHCDSFIKEILGGVLRAPILVGVLTAALLLAGGASAQPSTHPSTQGPVNLLATVPIPPAPSNTTHGLYAYDISYVDQLTQTYYLGDRSNRGVDVVDAATGTYLKRITATPPFAGVAASCPNGDVNACSGPNGVTAGGNCLFAGDTPSRIVSFKLPEGRQVSDINTGGAPYRVDEMAYGDGFLFVTNNANVPPFGTLLSAAADCKLTIIQKFVYNAASGVDATNGAEASVWNPATGLFYQSIPQTGQPRLSPNGPNGLVIGIDPKTKKIVDFFPVYLCQPAGNALNPTTGDLLLGCSVVFDTKGVAWTSTDPDTAAPTQVVMHAADGTIKAYVPGEGGSDELWYNAGDNHWYTASNGAPLGPSLGVIDGTSFALDQLVQTINVAAVTRGKDKHPPGESHSVAANAANSWVFVPHPANNVLPGCLTGCIGIYGR